MSGSAGQVPYNPLTNLDVIQDPVMQRVGISFLSIHTAGPFGQVFPEILIEGIDLWVICVN